VRYLHRPDHPKADEFGMVEAGLANDEPRQWATMVISDSMEPLKHHGTGRIIDSKARFRAETKAVGAVEIGNEPIKPRKPIQLDRRQRRDDIKRAVYELRNGINRY